MRQVALITAVATAATAAVLSLPSTSSSAPLDCTATPDTIVPSLQVCQQGFVTRSGTQLMLGGFPYTFAGVNIYNANNRDGCWYALNNSPQLTDAFNAVPPGSVVRAWFFQPQATVNGVRDWSAFDTTLALAAFRNIRVIPVLANQWAACDGPNGTGGDKKLDTWFTDGYKTTTHPGGTTDYRTWVAEVAARYKTDPTILAWQLMNEAEIIHRDTVTGSESCPTGAAVILHDFAADVSTLIKQVDPNHLVSLGTLGTGQCGTSFLEYATVHDIATIDLCEYHDYGSPNSPMPGDPYNGLAFRINQCNTLGKPVFVGETGIDPRDTGGTLAGRAAAFQAKLNAQFNAGVVGVLAWALDTDWSSLDGYDIGLRDPLLSTLPGASPQPTSMTLHVTVLDTQNVDRSVVTRRTGGAGCGGDCVAQLDDGATVTLTAEARGGSHFDGWYGPDVASCSGLTCTVVMGADRSVTANFVGDTDITPPTATVTSPVAAAMYPLLTSTTADYTCADNTGVASCAGTVAAGSPLPANTPGPVPFNVTAIDTSGNSTIVDASYTVSNTFADGLGLIGSFSSIPTAVSVTDAADPDGVTVTVAEGGTAPTLMNICGGFGAELSPGTSATLTCGSVTVSVTTGQVKVTTPDATASMTVPAGGKARLDANGVPQNLGTQPIVFAGPATHITAAPAVAVVATGVSQVFTVAAFDAYNQSLGDVTATAAFAITPSGTCTANSCRATTVGVRTVTATVGAMTATAVLDVRKAQTITFAAPTAKKMTQSPVALTATATSALPVTFVSTTPAVCATTGANGASVILVGPGTCSITAQQPGDSTWAAAPDVTRSFAVTKTTQTITFARLPARTIDQSPFTVTATASSGLPVAFASTTPLVCTSTGPNGSTIELVDAGTCTVRADQLGNESYAAAAPVTRSFAVSKLANTITFATITKKTLPESPFTATATTSSGLPVTFTTTTPAICTTNGADGSSIILVAAGTCTLRASQAGDAIYKAAAPVSRSFTVTKATQTITFAAIANQRTTQPSLTVTATATSGLAVQFSTTTPTVCVAGGANGSVITLLTVGTCTVRASQPGDASWSAATPVNRSFKVLP